MAVTMRWSDWLAPGVVIAVLGMIGVAYKYLTSEKRTKKTDRENRFDRTLDNVYELVKASAAENQRKDVRIQTLETRIETQGTRIETCEGEVNRLTTLVRQLEAELRTQRE
jgi:hypothetical protein